MTVTSIHTEKCCHLVSEQEASTVPLCSSVYTPVPDLQYIRTWF